jgi:hypothetical protein
VGKIVSNNSSTAVKAIAKELDDGYRTRPGEMFRAMISEIMVVWGFKPWVPVADEVRGKIDRAIAAYDRAVAESEPFLDILGPLYEELASRGGKQLLGQFFTPWPIACMMAEVTNPLELDVPTDRLLTVCDPACGSGILLLSTASLILRKQGADALRGWSFYGCDLDSICARMTAVQMAANCSVHNLFVGEVIVFCGNSLRPSEQKQIVLHATAPGVQVASATAPYRQGLIASAAASANLEPVDV